MVVTTDTVSQLEFTSCHPIRPMSVAAKALAVNLSDLAAMGAKPRAYTLSLALPKDWSSQESDLVAWRGLFRRLALGSAGRRAFISLAEIPFPRQDLDALSR